MPFDGSGNFNRVMNWQSDRDASIKIRADRHDQEDNNFASGLSMTLTKDGQSQPTADISWNGKKLTNLGAPTDPTDAATKAYAESIRSFNSPIKLTGPGLQSRIEFPVPNLSFGGVGTADPRFIWNNSFDASGTDLMVLRATGLTVLGNVTAVNFSAPGTSAILATGAASGSVILRPNGAASGTGQFVVGSTGNVSVVGNVTAGGDISGGGSITAAAGFIGNAVNAIVAAGAAGGNVWLRPNGYSSTAGQLRVDSAGAVIASGDIMGSNIRADGQLISQAVGSSNPTLNLRNSSSVVLAALNVASNVVQLENRSVASGNTLQLGSTGNLNLVGTSANITIAGSVATKATAGQWTAPSDIRLKNVGGDYTKGLAQLQTIQPVVYQLKAHPEFGDIIGLIAQDIEDDFPEMVALTEGYIDGQPVNDLRQFDPSAFTYVLINAVKELATRVEALEAA